MNEKRRMAKMTLRAEWQRRHARHFPLRLRWRLFRYRRKVRATWAQWWADLCYLARG